jgi:lipopolysaccharide biosynthesis protein
MNRSARLIAFYLPQFHPIPENDQWWGKGFTEWTNVAKAKPMFRGHYQPHIPADLGFYDLRLPEARIAQAEMARNYGIEAFCYYHYWFAGKRLLERPFTEVLNSGEPDFPFCLCWANQTWTGIWHGAPDRILIEQTYPGLEDHKAHFFTLISAFRDRRYVLVDGKPLLVIYRPDEMPDVNRLTDLWRDLAIKAGFKGIYLVGCSWSPHWIPQEFGFDAATRYRFPDIRPWISRRRPIRRFKSWFNERRGRPGIHNFKDVALSLIPDKIPDVETFPCLIPNWDNTPRSGSNGVVLHGSTAELFRTQLKKALQLVSDVSTEHKIIFIKSWNEWAEGNHLEPDLKFGRRYLQVIKDEVLSSIVPE